MLFRWLIVNSTSTSDHHQPSPRTKAQLSTELVIGSSSSLSRFSLSTLPAEEGGITLRSRHSVLGSDAGYSETIDGNYSDFGEAYGVYRC